MLLCYTCGVSDPAALSSPAYAFWAMCETVRQQKQISKLELCERAEISRTTYDKLPTRIRPLMIDTVHALADALGLDREEARRVAGLTPAKPRVTGSDEVRDAVLASTTFTDEQKDVLLRMMDVMDAANMVRHTER